MNAITRYLADLCAAFNEARREWKRLRSRRQRASIPDPFSN